MTIPSFLPPASSKQPPTFKRSKRLLKPYNPRKSKPPQLLLRPARVKPSSRSSKADEAAAMVGVSSASQFKRRQKEIKKSNSGGFQSMGLIRRVFRGVMNKGYKVPSKIQRRAIPKIIAGADVVAMAPTGSGKTAAFLVPMIQKLRQHVPGAGVRALILSPTRDLAIQTLKFTKELGKYTGVSDKRKQMAVQGWKEPSSVPNANVPSEIRDPEQVRKDRQQKASRIARMKSKSTNGKKFGKKGMGKRKQ